MCSVDVVEKFVEVPSALDEYGTTFVLDVLGVSVRKPVDGRDCSSECLRCCQD